MSIPKMWITRISKISRFLIIFLVIGWIFGAGVLKAQAGLTFVGKNSATGNSASFTVDLTALTGGISTSAAVGDLVIVADGWTGTTDGNPGVGTAGYTEEADLYSDDGFDANFSVNWKTMGGTPDSSVSCNGSGSTTLGAVCVVQVWRNAASTTPMDVTVVTSTLTNGAKPNCGPITPVTSGAHVICTVLATDDDNALPTVNAPTGYVNLVSAQVDPGSAVSGGMSSFAWTSGAEDPGALGNWDTTNTNSSANVTLAIRPAATFIGNDTDPGSNPTIAPEAATTTVDTFNLKTNKGGGAETVSDVTATFSEGSATGTVAVLVTDSGNTTTYCTTFNPSSATVNLTGCNLSVTSASTTFNLRIKPLTHGAMPAPPGSTYSVTATITSFTPATTTASGADTTSDTVTIDNASPNGATATSGTAGDQKVTLNWTASDSGDFDTTNGSVIYRWASGSAGSEVPDEGTTPSVGGTDGTATVACVISSAALASLIKIDGSGGDTGCTTSVLTNGQQYTYVAFQRDTNGNYDAGASIGTFTPAGVSLTFTIDTDNVSFVGAVTPGTPVSTSSVLTVNTNNSTGYNITINRASTTPTLFIFADNATTTVSDTPSGNNWTSPGASATTTAGPSAVWTDGTTKGLGFRTKQTGTNSGAYHSAWWGSSDAGANAKYSGISTSTAAQLFSQNNVGTGSNENITVEYRIDVSGTQRSGTYISSPVTYTATVNAP